NAPRRAHARRRPGGVPPGRRRRAAPPATARADPPRRRATPPRSVPRPPSRCGSALPTENRLLDLRICAAAADVSGHRVTDLLASRLGVRRDERGCRDDLAGRAEAALDGVGADERLDERVLAKPLDRRHLAVDRVRERDAREPRHAVDLDGAGAAMPLVACDLRPRQAKLLSQDVRETRPDRSVEDVLAAVHGEAQLAHVDVTATVSAI